MDGLVLVGGWLVVMLSLVYWSWLDHSMPRWDQACHLTSAINCGELLKHPSLDWVWFKQLFNISDLYPPLVYWVYGIAKSVFGTSRWVDVFLRCGFLTALYFTTFALGLFVSERKVTATVAALLACTYPLTYWLAHNDLLDLPGTVMVSVAILSLMWWKAAPSYKRAMATGAVCALTCMVKQSSVAFLVGPLLFVAYLDLRKMEKSALRQDIAALLTGILLLVPWLAAGGYQMFYNISQIQQQNFSADFLTNFKTYCSDLLPVCSPLLLVAFALSLIVSPRSAHKKLAYLTIASIGALIVMSLFKWIPGRRYLAPCLVPIAIYTSIGAEVLWRAGKKQYRILLLTISALAVVQFILYNFYPYPIPQSKSLDKLLHVYLGCRQDYPRMTEPYPTLYKDFGAEWTMAMLAEEKNTKRRKVLIFMPDSENVNAASWIYLAKRDGLMLDIWPARIWTMVGDRVRDDLKDLSLPDWYLLKTADQGVPFCDEASESRYESWCSFIRSSGRFSLYGEHQIADGSFLKLYKRK